MCLPTVVHVSGWRTPCKNCLSASTMCVHESELRLSDGFTMEPPGSHHFPLSGLIFLGFSLDYSTSLTFMKYSFWCSWDFFLPAFSTSWPSNLLTHSLCIAQSPCGAVGRDVRLGLGLMWPEVDVHFGLGVWDEGHIRKWHFSQLYPLGNDEVPSVTGEKPLQQTF